MNIALGSPTATEVARHMLGSGEAPPAAAVGKGALTLAWALKDLCYAAWRSEPQRAAKAARCIGRFVPWRARVRRTQGIHTRSRGAG